MKIGTDGVMLGAWASIHGVESALDIGTGTGLIALMLAQRSSEMHLTAIEINKDAADQAEENVVNSKYSDRIEVIHSAVQDFETTKKFDLIVSNPPFFNRSLKSPDVKRSLARHDETLPTEMLIQAAQQHLSENGRFAVVWPKDREEELDSAAAIKGLTPNRVMYVYPTPDKDCHRILKEYSFEKTLMQEESIVIEEHGRHGYSQDYLNMLKEFYLKF